jgi:malonyl-CoA decarboxylase
MSELETKLDESGVHRIAKKSVTLTRILESIIDTGRDILNGRRNVGILQPAQPEELGQRCQALIRHLGEASGLALASEILDDYAALPMAGRLEFFEILIRDFGVDPAKVIAASDRYRVQPDFEHLTAVTRAIEAPRQKLFRRLNMVPGGTSALVAMRGDLLKIIRERPDFKPLDIDLRQLLIEWFNRGFLVLESVSWSSSARVLEKIIAYEAVHEISGWDDLRGRLADDRRCFAFFHPAMPDDPIIFVEIALTKQSATTIELLIRVDHEIQDPRKADTATFYSISNCHLGLHGISFGNFLIKQVMEELRRDLPYVTNFETLSPVPGFRRWVEAITADPEKSALLQDDLKMIKSKLAKSQRPDRALVRESEKTAFLRLCAHYLLNEKSNRWPLDPVARFHLSNGASLDRINWSADCSAAGEDRSFGIMVNYVYRAADIETNHEAYFAEDQVAASAAVRKLTRR